MIGILVNKTFGIVAGLASAAFVGYCVYFDMKRRCHPDYKKSIYERRRRNRKPSGASNGIPNLSDQKSIESYFMQEIQKGEILITDGNYEGAAEHLMNAIVVCNKPGKLLSVLQNTLPEEVFSLLVHKLNAYNMNAQRSHSMHDGFASGLVVDDGSVE
ncbi:hypothetical protein KR044_000872 [Drosophila immigrans]|nr:hypothetical protein KR044_000872 [Drosophila immigrans]